ncbi:MAG: zf-HC2 domain-containing protein [Planctomycetes bacterium]|nr:zf-HC2 domain-containing protein [Planctomycetota bacterium]
MLNCKQTARLISEGLDRKLSLRQRMNLWMHLAMCGACSAYRRQIQLINRLVRRRFTEQAADRPEDGPACPSEAKQRITQTLKDRESM